MNNMNTLMPEKKLNIAIVGYGKMGKLIAAIATRRGHTIACTVDPQGGATFSSLSSLVNGVDTPKTTVSSANTTTVNTTAAETASYATGNTTATATSATNAVATNARSTVTKTNGAATSTDTNLSNATDPTAMTYPAIKDTIDICIDFSTPDSFKNNVATYGQLKKPLVVGTTGWNQQHSDILSNLTEQKVPILYGSNFSIGMQLFIRLIAEAAKQFSNFTTYDFGVVEQHHNQKLDNPSGTALTIAETIVANHSHINEVVTNEDVVPNQPHQLHVTGLRIGTVPGTHTVAIDSHADTITLQHTARNREGFGLGAVLGAEWLVGKQGCFNVTDFIDEIQ